MTSVGYGSCLITAKQVKDGDSHVYAWCDGVGICKILHGSSRSKTAMDALVVGQWYNFRVKPDDKQQGKMVAFVKSAVPIKAIRSTTAQTSKRTGLQYAKVFHVPAVVGAVQVSAGVAFAWSPFFHRIGFQQLNSFSHRDCVKTGAILLLTIEYKLVDEDSNWKVAAIERRLATDAVQQMGIEKVSATFVSFDANKHLCWAKGEKGEKICFGPGDIEKQQESAIEFQSGNRFLMWIGQRHPLLDYHRAIYVRQIIDSVPRHTSFDFCPPVQSLKKKQEAYDEDDWWPLAASTSSSSLPSVPMSPAPEGTSTVNGNGFIIINNQQKTSKEKGAPTSELNDGKWWQRVPELEPYLTNGRQLFARIMKHLDVCGPIIQRDPALFGDLCAHFHLQS